MPGPGDTPEVLASLWGRARVVRTRGQLDVAVQLGHQLIELGRRSPSAALSIAGHECAGMPTFFLGDPATAARHLAEAVQLIDDALLGPDAGSLVLHPDITCRSYLSCAQWVLGNDEEAQRLSATARGWPGGATTS